MTAELTPSDAEVGWNALAEAAVYTHYRPLADAAHRFIADTQTNNRVYLGIPALDVEMRGISAGHLCMLVGYSHSGKTLVALHIIGNNQNKRVAYFVPDEPAPLVLTKLACMSWGVSGAELEGRVADDDPWGVRILNETIEQYSQLAVFDRSLTPRAMTAGYAEACDCWGAPADLIIVDYMDLVQAGEGVMGKADFLKSFGTEHDVPMLVLHQTSRTAGAKGQAMRIDSGGYGGETHATFQIGVWRKRAAIAAELADLEARAYQGQQTADRINELHHQLAVHQYTLSLNLNKNKRPSGHLVDTLDFEIDLETGTLTPLYGDLPQQFYRGGLR